MEAVLSANALKAWRTLGRRLASDTAIRKLERGLQSDVKSVGEGVREARIDYGPGYRLYFASDGRELVILLLCGDKRTQAADVAAAKAYWRDYRTRKTPRATR